jgi:ABC-type branched-subunit amino acid transport system substrate-binding protein
MKTGFKASKEQLVEIRSLLLIIIFLMAQCGLREAFATPLKVGLTLPLSGSLSSYGEAFRRGVTLFNEENTRNSGKVNFVIDDSQYDGKKVASSIRKLVDIDKVDALYVWGVLPSQVAAPIAQQIGVPLVAMTVDPVSKGRPSVASLQLPIESIRASLLQFIRDKKYKKIGVIGAEVGAVTPLLELLRGDLPGLAYFEIVQPEASDFRSLVSKIRPHQVDAMIVMVNPEQTLPLARQLVAQKVKAHIIGGDMLSDDTMRGELVRLAGEVSYVYGEVEDEFRQRYLARFGDTSHLYEAAAGYSTSLFFEQMVESTNFMSRADIISSLVGHHYPTPIGDINFGSSVELGVHAMLRARVYSDSGLKP